MNFDPITLTGRFASAPLETGYRAAQLTEHRRLTGRVLQCALVVNLLFYLSDWRFHGQPHFRIALIARTTIVAVSLLCWLLLGRVRTPGGLQRLCLAWSVPVMAASALLITPHTDAALLIALALPAVFYLVLPLPPAPALLCGAGFSVLAMAAYLLPAPADSAASGVLLGMLTINVVLALTHVHWNRLRRQQWSATRAVSGQRRMLHRILQAVPVPLIVSMRTGDRIIALNEAARRQFGNKIPERLPLDRLTDRRDLARLRRALRQHGGIENFETRLLAADRTVHDILLALTTVQYHDVDALVTVWIDITGRKEMEADLQRLANTDALTGIANRARFFAAAASEIGRSRRAGQTLSVVMIDIDLFKHVNDTHGHEIGDRTLTAFCNLCRGLIRDQDLLARLGGEEFGLMLPHTDRAGALALAERIRAAVEQTPLATPPVRITVSLGIAGLAAGETGISAALSRADQALYAAKRAGRNRTVHFDDLPLPQEPPAG